MSNAKHTPSQAGGRVPPHNIGAEMSVLASMLLDRTAAEEARALLTHDDFYRDAHGRIFAVMCDLLARGIPPDYVSVTDELTRLHILDAVGGWTYLLNLQASEFTSANLSHYGEIVRKKASNRRVIETCSLLASMAYDDPEDSAVLIEEAERRIFSLRPKNNTQSNRLLTELVKEEFDLPRE